MADYFESRFAKMDTVGFDSFYHGPPLPRWARAQKGLAGLLNSRVHISGSDALRHIVIKDLWAPVPYNLPINDIWRYANLLGVLRPPYDLAVFGYPGNAWLARFLKQSGRVKHLIYDDWDYHPGLGEDGLSRHWLEQRERSCARESDAVMTVNVLLGRMRIAQGARRVIVIPNGVDLALFGRARQKVPHPPTLVYMGSLSRLWGIDTSIRAIPRILEPIPSARMLIVGKGPAEGELKELSRSLGIADRVTFLAPVEYEGLPSILAQADIGVASSSPSSTFRYYASPLKLMEYMAAGLPVIATRIGQTEATMQEADAGILVNHSVEEFAQAAIDLLTDQAHYRRCSEAGVRYTVNFDWDLLMETAYRYALHVLGGESVPGVMYPPV